MATRWKARLNGKRFLIFLHGEPDSGKSTLLKGLGSLLLPESDSYKELRIVADFKGNRISSADKDILCIRNGVSIAIRTIGDAIGEVEYAIAKYVNSNANVIIVASRWDSAEFCVKCSNKTRTAIKSFYTCDIPSIRKLGTSRGDSCYTTSREMYLHLLHLLKTGSFE